MSDPFNDAYRPENKPKGYGWWEKESKIEYCQKIWGRGDRDWWLIVEMHSLGINTRDETRELLWEWHPEWCKQQTTSY